MTEVATAAVKHCRHCGRIIAGMGGPLGVCDVCGRVRAEALDEAVALILTEWGKPRDWYIKKLRALKDRPEK